jgi:uncharacterized membrane protein YdbT with pleckstrin-like domain
MIETKQWDISEPIPRKSAKPKNYLRLLFIPVAIATIGVFLYCIWNILPWFIVMVLTGPVAGYSILQLVKFITE